MLYEESLWFKDIISRTINDGSLVLNIGSSTKEFIELTQPYIKSNILDVLSAKNCVVKNIDIKDSEGVDLVGDVMDVTFIKQLKELNASAIICANLLEHLEDRKAFCNALTTILNKDTLLLVSVPFSFPYHEDPIDTLYRPSVNDLQNAFPKLKLVNGNIVHCGTFFQYITQNLSAVGKLKIFIVACIKAPLAYFYDKQKYLNWIWYFKGISTSCVTFKIK